MSPDARLEPRDALAWLGQPEVTSNALSLCDAEQLTTLGHQHRKPNRGEDRSGSVDASAKEDHDRLRTIQNKPYGMNGDEPLRVCRRPFGLSHAAMAGCSSIA